MSHEQTLAEMICDYIRDNVEPETRARFTCLRDVLDEIDESALDDFKEMMWDCILRELRFLHIDEILRNEAQDTMEEARELRDRELNTESE